MNFDKDAEIAVALKKALTSDSSAPKQKHVRSIILYTWNSSGSNQFFPALTSFPMLQDDIIIYKALILFHKTISQGHPSVLKEAMNQISWLDAMSGAVSGNESSMPWAAKQSYALIIKAYVVFLKLKLNYHKIRPYFSGSFDYEEFVSLKGVQDPNEGYETIEELLQLLNQIHKFYLAISNNIRSSGMSECRVAALVPLVEESYGIYRFIVSMMTAMHMVIGSVEVLGPLRDSFSQEHRSLKAIYEECRSYPYLTALISIPVLGMEPNFLEKSATVQPKQKDTTEERRRERELMEEQEQEQRMNEQWINEQRLNEQRMNEQHMNEQRMQEQRMNEQRVLEQQEYERELLRQQTFKAQELQRQDMALNSAQQAEYYRQQSERNRDVLMQYEQRINQLTNELQRLATVPSVDTSKYDSLAKLYAQLRKEHLELIQKHKALKDIAASLADENRRKYEALEMELNAKKAELTQLLVERNRLRDSGSDSRAGFDREKRLLEADSFNKQSEIEVLQASLDQALEILKQHQEESLSGLSGRDDRILMLERKHSNLLGQMMDNVLETCIATVQEAIFNLDLNGNASTAELVLLLTEKASQKSIDLSTSFINLVNGLDPREAVLSSANFAQSISQVLTNGNSLDESLYPILKAIGQTSLQYLSCLKTNNLYNIQEKPLYISNLSKDTLNELSRATLVLESLSSASNVDGGENVEREMSQAAQMVAEASSRLQAILARQPDLAVHSAILQATVALTTAIGYLIKCATDSQNEIVGHGGGATTTAFYKKNNKWTQGLISAAHSVASATVFLVTRADGLIENTHSWEQLVVAAQDVGVCTTQLVSAARVKAQMHSKTHDKLEGAAGMVREATKLLVKAAKDASKVSSEQEARAKIGSMTKHDQKVQEMEQQVRILELEKLLSTSRFTLGEMRKQNYHDESQ